MPKFDMRRGCDRGRSHGRGAAEGFSPRLCLIHLGQSLVCGRRVHSHIKETVYPMAVLTSPRHVCDALRQHLHLPGSVAALCRRFPPKLPAQNIVRYFCLSPVQMPLIRFQVIEHKRIVAAHGPELFFIPCPLLECECYCLSQLSFDVVAVLLGECGASQQVVQAVPKFCENVSPALSR